MTSPRIKVLSSLVVFALTLVSFDPIHDLDKQQGDQAEWSEESNGLKARLLLSRREIKNGSGIIASHIDLQNVGDTSSPLLLTVDPAKMTFQVVDENGKEVAQNGIGIFSALMAEPPQLTIPYDCSMRVRIGPTGHAIPKDVVAHLDLGPNYCRDLPQGKFFLSAVFEIEESIEKDDADGLWHGRIEFPPVLIPTKPISIAPKKLTALIEELGAKMLSSNSRESETAFRRMSLINDPRVVDWYVKAVNVDRYSSKCSALDRLGYFSGDEAFEGLKIGIGTKPEDVSSADNVRRYAFNGLARSPHPQAKALILSLHDDPSASIRLSVVQAAAKMATAESLALVKLHVVDDDPMIQEVAKRLLESFEKLNAE